MAKQVVQLDRVIIRFAGDSGDGMQLTGDRFTSETASFGNDLSTLPNFPAEIRAPAGTLPGVCAFQLHFADHDILTPGDAPNVLVAMNPAALKANLADLPRGADIIVNTDEFTKRDLAKVGYAASPLEDGSLDAYNVHPVPLTTHDRRGAQGLRRAARRRPSGRRTCSRSACCPGCTTGRPRARSRSSRTKFAKKPEIVAANLAAFRAGWNFGETTEDFAVSYEVEPAADAGRAPTATSPATWPCPTAWSPRRSAADLPLFLGSYPITPASDILHELSKHKNFGVRTFQAEDEIAGIGAALGAAFGGALGGHHHLRPGRGAEVRDDRPGGLAGAAAARRRHPARRAVDRPADQDRAGRPAAGDVRPQRRGAGADRRAALPRRLLRRGDRGGPDRADLPHPGLPALRRLPGQRLRAVARSPTSTTCPTCASQFATEPNHTGRRRHRGVLAVQARPGDPRPPLGGPRHARARAPHRRHREGRTAPGNISYDPANHDLMVRTRQAKIDGIERSSRRSRSTTPPAAARRARARAGARPTGRSAPPCRRLRRAGGAVAQAHLRHLNPFPANLGEVLASYDKVVVPEMNLGQLAAARPRPVPGRRASPTTRSAACRSRPSSSPGSSRR